MRTRWTCACLGVLACSGQASSIRPTEPIQIASGQFVAGPLPGAPPEAVDGGDADAGEPSALGIDDAVSRPFGPLAAGAMHQQFSGFATQDTVAIGVALADGGTGYWVVPVGGLDPIFPGKVDWGFFADFNPTVPAGRHTLHLVAIGGGGQAGRQVDVSLCVDATVPDNGHACIPTRAPPASLIALRWDDAFDLDLHVVTPDGTDVSAKTPSDDQADGDGADAGGAAIDRDSQRGCVADNLREEDVVFQSPPPAGVYDIYVNPFSACGQLAARFTVTVYALTGTCPACELEPTFSQGGELLAAQVTGDFTPGLFVQELELPQGP